MKALFASACVFAMSASAFADYRSDYQAAFADFQRRGENTSFASTCVDKAGTALGQAANDNEKYDALVLQARCTYYLGMKAGSDAEKIRVFNTAKAFAERAKPLAPNRAEAYFFYGISLGRWAEANGILRSLGERHNLRRNMESVIGASAGAFDDDSRAIPGREYDAWGANRTLGRMYFKLPGMFGGDNNRAEALLREAVERQPRDYPNSLNVFYLAEILVANNKKAEARRLLDDVLAYENQPERYNPRRVPETIDEMRMIRALRRDIGN